MTSMTSFGKEKTSYAVGLVGSLTSTAFLSPWSREYCDTTDGGKCSRRRRRRAVVGVVVSRMGQVVQFVEFLDDFRV